MAHSSEGRPVGDAPVAQAVSFRLPTQVFGVIEVRRLSRELEALDEYMRQAGLREAGSTQDTLPRVSRLLDATAIDNRLNLLQSDDRKKLADFLQQTMTIAPVVHMSFASDPSASFLEKIVSWLRGNIHPLVLVRLGLQPSIAAGCVLRTANQSFDFSLRHRFTEERELLLYSLESGQVPEVSQPVIAQPVVPQVKKIEVVT